MLPGVVVPPTGLPQVQQGDLCAIALVGNRYCVSLLCVGCVEQRYKKVEENDPFQSTWTKN